MAMVAMRIISETTIQPRTSHKNVDSSQSIELTPWDLQFLPIETIQCGLLFHNPTLTLTPHREALIQHLRDSLSSTLDFFPPLAGRLIVAGDDGTCSVFVACNNDGASFVHAVAENTSVSDILKPTYVPPIVYSFFPLNRAKNFEGTSNPLLAVQVTELADGIFVGCTMNHCVGDGNSFWYFFNSWAEISRCGLNHKLSNPPLLKRWFPDGIDPPIPIPFSETKQKQLSVSHPPLPERVFHFTRKKIAELKAKANSEVETSKISSLQAVLSHVWRSVIRNQNLDPEEEVTYRFIIGARPRMTNPAIPENYFGSALQFVGITMKAGDLVSNGGLGRFALEMNKVIASHTQEKFKRDFQSWVENPRLHNVKGRIGKVLGTLNSPRFNVYRGNDFGWGQPAAPRNGPCINGFGKLTVYCGAEEGSMDISLCLSYEILEAMGRDPEFLDAVSVNNMLVSSL